MTDEQRQARHDLRTPINHILSYARLALDEAEDLDLDEETEAHLDAIQAAGHQALVLIDALLTRPGPAEQEAVASLAARIMEQAERVSTLAAGAGHTQVAEDAGRIAEAARQLASLVEHTSTRPDVDAKPDTGATNRADTESPVVGARFVAPATMTGALLVVDDNEPNRDVLSRSLTRLGYTVHRAEDGRAALDVLAQTDIDLVLLDIMMPVLDGYAVLEHRRQDARLRAIPFIVISATGDDASVIRCIEMGAEDYLPKPFDPVLLRARIGACLEKKRLHDQEQRHLETIQAQAAALAEWNQTLEQRVAEQVTCLERLSGLKRFLPPQLAETIVATGDASLLERHRRRVAIVFCDLRGFTPFSETAEPEEVMDVLDQYHTAMGTLVAWYAGTVEHFAGDGLMVLFNDPLPCPEPERQAVRMAVEMREQMAALTAGWNRRGQRLGFGVGITYGYATLGQIGFAERLHYAAIGSVVNLAARLCGEAKDGQILASPPVGLAVEEIAELRAVGDLPLKGIHAPVPAVEIVGLRG